MSSAIRISSLSIALFLTLASFAQLNGTYTIDQSGAGDYVDFTSAVADLSTLGISGPVVLEVEDGTYTEKLSLPPIAGSSATNTIIFRGQSLDSSLVTLRQPAQSSSLDNFVIEMNGMDHVAFEHMRLQRYAASSLNRYTTVVQYGSGTDPSQNTRFSNVLFNGAIYTSSPNSATIIQSNNSIDEQNVLIENSRFVSGGYSMDWGANGGNDALTVQNCTFNNTFNGIVCSTFNGGLVLKENSFDGFLSSSSNPRAISLNFCTGGFEISKNKVDMARGIAINLSACNGAAISPGLVVNNALIVYSIYSSDRGLQLSGNCSYLNILNNSISVNRGTGFWDSSASTSSNMRLVNNIFTAGDLSGYPIFRFGSGNYSECEHNMLFNFSPSASARLARWGAIHYNMPALQTASGLFANSFDADPLFVDPANDLHLQSGSPCAGVGKALASVSEDIDGESRPNPVASFMDIGADETPDYCYDLNGTYVIGSSAAADFVDFSSAISHMERCGISGPVVFDVEDGTYTEKLFLYPIAGSSPTNTITFRGQSLDSSLVTLRQIAQSSASENFVIGMRGMDYVAFEHMRLYRYSASSTRRYAGVVNYETGVDPSQNTRFSNMSFIGDAYGSYTFFSPIIRSFNSADELDVLIENSLFIDGGKAIDWAAQGANDALTVQNCTFSYTYDGINCTGFDGGLKISENSFLGFQSSNYFPRAIYLQQCIGGFELSKNKVDIFRGDAIYLNSSNGTALSPGLVANNALIVYSSYGSDSGLELLGDCSYLNILNNSISVNRGRGFVDNSASTSSNMRLVNNIFTAGYQTGYPIFRAGTGNYSECEHNLLYNFSSSASARLARWGGTYYALPTLQTASGLFANSLEANPLFVSLTNDLHLQSGSPCAGVGKALALVTDDVDGDARPNPVGSFMDIGADESPEGCQDLNGTYVIGPSAAADFSSFNDAVDQMTRCGISGPVVFNVESGFYTEKLDLKPFTGNSATNTITFQSITGDSTDVVLRSPTVYNNPLENYTVHMNGADYVTIRGIQIERYGSFSSVYFAGVIRYGNTDPSIHSSFENCRILNYGGVNVNDNLVHVSNAIDEESFQFLNCAFVNGFHAISANANYENEHLTIQGCTFQQSRSGIYLEGFLGGGSIVENVMSGFVAGGIRAIDLNENSGGWTIAGNRIVGASTALYMFEQQGTTAAPTRIFNNVFSSNGGPSIYNDDATHMFIANNTCMSSSDFALEVAGSSSLTIRNNLFLTETGVFPVSVDASSTITASDRNLYNRVAGTTAVTWGGNSYGSAAALNAGTGMDANSFFAFAGMYDVSLDDLRSYSMHANNAASSLAYVPTDIEGTVRHPSTPDIGAYEFTPELWQEQLDVCYSFDQLTSTGSGLDQYIYADKKVIGRINDNGNNLGLITGEIYLNSGVVRTSPQGQYYMDRNWQIEPANQPGTQPVDLELYYAASEFADLAALDPSVANTGDVGVSQYDGPNENCNIADNTSVGNYFQHYPVPASTIGELAPLTQVGSISLSVPNFSEFYVTAQGSPLPVELIAMNAERVNPREVSLTWSTASERDNQGFEVYRRRNNEAEFEQVAWVEGNGTTNSTVAYRLVDQNATEELSYYYLRQIDFNGDSEILPVVVVEGSAYELEWLPYPNPALATFSLSGDMEELKNLELIDASGRTVRSFSSNFRNLPIGDISKGLYQVHIEMNNGSTSSKPLMIR